MLGSLRQPFDKPGLSTSFSSEDNSSRFSLSAKKMTKTCH